MVISDALFNATEKLKAISSVPSLESKLLLESALNCDRLYLIKNRNAFLSLSEEQEFNSLVSVRLTGCPIAYIIGHREFMGLDFSVNKNVLIPRPDTETLVEYAIGLNKKNILDIGTGSGAIAVSLAKYIEGSRVTATDISSEALKTAEKNAAANGVHVDFYRSDILSDDIFGTYDLIASNPPYIKDSVIPTLETDVKDFEPQLALSGGEDGLKFYRAICKKAPSALNEDGILLLEIGFDQGEDVKNLMSEHFCDIKILKDLSGCSRVCTGRKK